MSELHPEIKRPGETCGQIESTLPHVFRFIERRRQALARQRPWPRWAYAPTEIIWDVIDEYSDRLAAQAVQHTASAQLEALRKLIGALSKHEAQAAERLIATYARNQIYNIAAHAVALAGWRVGGKHVLVLHDEVLDELWASGDVDESIPTEVLAQLPYWAGYIPVARYVEGRGVAHIGDETFEMEGGALVHGVLFALLWQHRAEHRGPEYGVCHLSLDISTSRGTEMSIGMALPMDERTSIRGALIESVALDDRGMAQRATDALAVPTIGALFARAAQLVLYLCAANAEARIASPPERAAPPRPKTPQQDKLFAPSQETVWAIGYRLGAAIRAAREAVRRAEASAPTGRTVRPHMRRGHWHGYRVGPGRTGWKVIWLPPIPVGLPKDVDTSAWAELLPTTQRRITW